MIINNQEIIKRGYATTEEYKEMNASGKLSKLNMEGEGFWVFPLEDDDIQGKKFHFIFFNDPMCIIGPRPMSGMVGIATSNGKEKRASAIRSECVALCQKAGQPAIDYFNEEIKKLKKRASSVEKVN